MKSPMLSPQCSYRCTARVTVDRNGAWSPNSSTKSRIYAPIACRASDGTFDPDATRCGNTAASVVSPLGSVDVTGGAVLTLLRTSS